MDEEKSEHWALASVGDVLPTVDPMVTVKPTSSVEPTTNQPTTDVAIYPRNIAVGDQDGQRQRSPTVSSAGEDKLQNILKLRMWHLLAFVTGVAEVYFSVENAVSEDAFKLKNGKDAVFYASAVMESVGLAVMFIIALLICAIPSLIEWIAIQCDEAVEGDGQEGGGDNGHGQELLVEFGAPLAVIMSGILQENSHLERVGYIGSMFQALVVCYVFYRLPDTDMWTVGFFIAIAVMCCFAGVYYSLRRNPGLLFRFTSIMVFLPICVDVAEVVLLMLGGESVRAMILSILDILAISLFVGPWGLQKFKESLPGAAETVADHITDIRESITERPEEARLFVFLLLTMVIWVPLILCYLLYHLCCLLCSPLLRKCCGIPQQEELETTGV